jgi:hypothetical protein
MAKCEQRKSIKKPKMPCVYDNESSSSIYSGGSEAEMEPPKRPQTPVCQEPIKQKLPKQTPSCQAIFDQPPPVPRNSVAPVDNQRCSMKPRPSATQNRCSSYNAKPQSPSPCEAAKIQSNCSQQRTQTEEKVSCISCGKSLDESPSVERCGNSRPTSRVNFPQAKASSCSGACQRSAQGRIKNS